ncbi:hypothetical protein [Urechidicola croceus]|uniref:hypothetical protein n=1 Tax=Urechidicola croceus TaxID=1850246 RepID=UPI0012EAB672|nr:hypothetical protein [Urechidicola croceus]
MKNQILSLVFFMLTTTLLVVQGNSKKVETTNQNEVNDFVNVAQADTHENELKSAKFQ